MLLPNFFVQSEDNKKFTESDELKEMIERMKEKLIGVIVCSNTLALG